MPDRGNRQARGTISAAAVEPVPLSDTSSEQAWQQRPTAAVMAMIARQMLHPAVADEGANGESPDGVGRLGSITLTHGQRDAVRRCKSLLAQSGGALLADGVGTGKTFVALAIASSRHRVVVVAPAALLSMWRSAARQCGVQLAALLSIESLGRRNWSRSPGACASDLVIVDEAHHARNPATARHARLAALCASTDVLLVTATPVHNDSRDLRALLGLFLGEHAGCADADRYIVRRPARLEAGRPQVLPTRALSLPPADDLLRLIVALPPPVPPSDAGEAGALAMLGLVRQWASSDGALRAAIVRRLTTAVALGAALRDGDLPSRRALRRWIAGEGTVQLALPGLDLGGGAPVDGDRRSGLLAAVVQHEAGLRAMLARLDAGPDSRTDGARARHLTGLLAEGRHIVAFSHSADTVRALFRLLRQTPGVAMLTSQGARVAGGVLRRDEALARFAPRAQGVAPPHAAESIRLLLTTDLVSEGVNLQDGDTVVHVDLPWTPARLAQRVGRIARAGSPHAWVHVYAMAAPASARTLLRVEQRLRRKARAAMRGFGITVGWRDEQIATDLIAPREALRAALARWDVGDDDLVPNLGGIAVGHAVTSVTRHAGVLALVAGTDPPTLVWIPARGRITTSPATIAAIVRDLDTTVVDHELRTPDIAGVQERLSRWLAEMRARSSLGGHLATATGVPARQSPAHRLVRLAATVVRDAPWHRRSALTRLSVTVRRLIGVPLPHAVEVELRALAEKNEPDEPWLTLVAARVAVLLDARPVRGTAVRTARPSTVVAILIVSA